MALVPQYSFTCQKVFIPLIDKFWDIKKWKSEEAELRKGKSKKEADEAAFSHPLTQYTTGWSRYDVSTVRQYVLEDQLPPKFFIRELTLLELEQCETAGSTNVSAGQRYAFQLGITDIQNVPGVDMSSVVRTTNGMLPITFIEDLRKIIGKDLIYAAGQAVLNASADHTEPEKKV